jgi:hypothetical protein
MDHLLRLILMGELNTKITSIKKYIKVHRISSVLTFKYHVGAGRSAEDRLLCKQEAMGSNPIRSIPIFPFQKYLETPSNLLVNWMVRT